MTYSPLNDLQSQYFLKNDKQAQRSTGIMSVTDKLPVSAC